MKYIISLLIAVQVFTFSTRNVFAANQVAGALEPTQLLNNVELIGVNISDAATAAATYADMIKNTVLDPIQAALINTAVSQAADSIVSWAQGGFEGEPLIISNPESFIKNQGLNAVKAGLSGIPEGTIFGDSIFNSVARKYMNEGADLSEQLANLSKSELPGIIRNNFCDDATLTSYALEDVQAINGEVSNSELVARKNELYQYACEGDINDPEVQAKLMDLGEQRPSIGGWDQWLAVTGGENDYTKTVKGLSLFEEEEARKRDLATKEIFEGAGPISQTKCLQEAVAGAGEIANCLNSITINPGGIVGDVLAKGQVASLDRLINLDADGFSGLFTTLITTMITKGFDSSSGSSGSNTSNVTLNTRPPTQDLAYDATKKAAVTSPMNQQFKYDLEALDSLQATDNDYMADLLVYEAKVDAGLSCFNTLVADGMVNSSDSRIAFYNSRKSRVTTTKNTIQTDLQKITEKRTLIADTKAKIAASNSTEEISRYFDTYITTVDARELPKIQTVAVRKGEYTKNKADTKNDKEVTDYYNQCVQIQQSRDQYNGNGY